ncbi:MAG: glutamyl-tRNA reductase [Bryobacteraceae bacterium]
MKLVVTGVSHRTAPVEVRERLAISNTALPSALAQLRSLPGVEEAFILSTCNRVEIAASSDDACDLEATLEHFLAGGRESLEPYVYRHEGRQAVQHVFRVAASLDSMVVGEPQILGQLKAAYQAAKGNGAIRGLLEAVLERAFSVAKRVRSETGIGQMAVSVSYAAVELARKIFGSLDGRKVLLVGAGKMSELSARHLRRSGAEHIFVTNRTAERAAEMAKLFQGTPVDYDRFPGLLPEVDIVIASSGATEYILRKPDLQRATRVRRNRPMFLIDIAVPRNIDPEVNTVDNVFLYDIDDLQEVVNANLRERHKEADHAERIVEQEVERMMARLKVQEVVPTIVSLQEQLEQIRAGEVERVRGKLGPLTTAQEEAIESLTRGIVSKIAHLPIAELRRRAADPEGLHVIDAIRKVLHLK